MAAVDAAGCPGVDQRRAAVQRRAPSSRRGRRSGHRRPVRRGSDSGSEARRRRLPAYLVFIAAYFPARGADLANCGAADLAGVIGWESVRSQLFSSVSVHWYPGVESLQVLR